MELGDKKNIRAKILSQRNEMTCNEVNLKSDIIIKKLKNLKQYKDSFIIMCYMDFKNEVRTSAFISQGIEDRKRFAVPLVAKTNNGKRKIIAVEIQDLNKDLSIGTYGILEPHNIDKKVIQPEMIDMAVVPGVAFDLKRNRIGFGAGYYDRFFSDKNKGCFKVGIGYDYQIHEGFHTNPYDIPMDFIITEARII